jgi:hypothetical protein
MHHLSFQINNQNLEDFIEHWSSKYFYESEEKYNNNIGNPLTEKSLLELFEWKNGSTISRLKLNSISENYPLSFSGDQEDRYLNHNQSGGAIWNIFYLHCIERNNRWPIYDQHTHRAMMFISSGKIVEIGTSNKSKYASYKDYIHFLKSLNQTDYRKLDKALFAFGQFLKIANKYV